MAVRSYRPCCGGDHRSCDCGPAAEPPNMDDAAEHYRQGWQAGHAAADPPALVALVAEWRQAVTAPLVPPPEMDDNAARTLYRRARSDRADAAHKALLAYPLPAAPPVTDTPQGVITTREFDRCSCGHYRCWHLDGSCHWHIHEIVGARVPCGCEQFAPAVPSQEDQ